jgi:hypothetical protein
VVISFCKRAAAIDVDRHTLALPLLLQHAAHGKVQLRPSPSTYMLPRSMHGAAKCDDTRSLINHATATRRTPLEQGVATCHKNTWRLYHVDRCLCSIIDPILLFCKLASSGISL